MRAFTKEWLYASKDDLLIMKEIIHNEHLSHMVAFHAQQSVEKSMKALIEELQIEIPKIHKLIKLHSILEQEIKVPDKTILYRLDQLYIEARYPGDMGLLPNGKPTKEDAEMFYDFAIMIFDEVCKVLKIDKKEYFGEF